MVLVEAGRQVASDRLLGPLAPIRAESIGDELQVLFEVLLRPSRSDELLQAIGGGILEPWGLCDREDAVLVSREFAVLSGIESLAVALGVDQPRPVKAVSAHHAADGVGNQPLDVFLTVRAVQGNLFFGDFGAKFVLQPVGFDEEAVVLFFELLHAGEAGQALSIGGCLGLLQCDTIVLKCGNPHEVPRSFKGVPVGL